MINAGISVATAVTGTGAPLASPAVVEGDGFVEQLGDVNIAGKNGTTAVVAEVTFLDIPVDGALRLYAPQPGNGRE